MTASGHWEIPYSSNRLYVGYEALLATFPERLAQAPLLLAGMGGIGKSALAIEYADRARARYDALIWLDASSATTVNAQFAQISRSAPELFQHLWAEASRTLLILDNVFDVEVARGLLPPGWAGHLLLTTRMLPQTLLHMPLLLVPPLSQEDGAQLLLRRGKVISMQGILQEATELQRSDALAISEAMGGFPLALEQAGAYLEATHSRPGTYRAFYDQWPARLLGDRGTLPGRLHPESVASVVETLMESLVPESLELLRVLASLPPEAIPLAPSFDREALDELRLRFLIQACDETETMWCLHRVVQTLVREHIPEEQRAWYGTQAAAVMNEGRMPQ